MVSKCGYRYGKAAAGERILKGFVRFDKRVLCLSLHMAVELITIRTDARTTEGTVARGQEKNTKKPSENSGRKSEPPVLLEIRMNFF